LARNTIKGVYLNNVVDSAAAVVVSATTLESNTVDATAALSSTPLVVEIVQT
jgi:hypothetical protein